MGTWAKENVTPFDIVNWTTGVEDSSSHTVKLQPVNQDYPTGAITCSQCTTNQYRWRPDSDLDDSIDYWIYVDTVKKGLIPALNSVSNILGGD